MRDNVFLQKKRPIGQRLKRSTVWKRGKYLLFSLGAALSLVACGSSDNNEVTEKLSKEQIEGKVLIAYFAVAENSEVDAVASASVVSSNDSRGKMKALADMIQEETGGDLFSIQTSVEYPGDKDELIEYADQEQEVDARPELTNHIENLEEYDTIFIGYPTWWYDLPQVMYSFFDEYDFSGKTIIPFNCHNGSRFSGTIDTIAKLEPDAAVVEDGFTVSERNVADADKDIAKWIKDLGY